MNEREYKIALSLVKGVGPVSYRAILARLESEQIPVEDLFQGDEEILTGQLALSRLRQGAQIVQGIIALREDLSEIRETLDLLSERDVTIITMEDEEYPRRLTENLDNQAAPVLYCYGNVDLLGEPSGAIVGSRSPDEDASELSRQAASILVRGGRTVVSGCARGVDAAAHHEALDAGGNTIGVLSQGILATRTLEAFAATADPSSFLLVSEFPPKRTWDAGAAMSRNKTICALADVVIVVQAGERGGTKHAGATALKMGKPVFAISPPSAGLSGWEGNEALMREGALPLGRNEETGDIDFSPVLDPPDRKAAREASEQQTLF